MWQAHARTSNSADCFAMVAADTFCTNRINLEPVRSVQECVEYDCYLGTGSALGVTKGSVPCHCMQGQGVGHWLPCHQGGL